MEMTRGILIQYCDLQEEIKDLRIRINDTQRKIEKMEEAGYQVKDSVTGTRSDGTFGSITIKGFPFPEYGRRKQLLRCRLAMLRGCEEQLLDLTNKVEQYIEGIKDGRIRRIMRYRYLDDCSWIQVAHRMGGKHTADSCRNAHDRFLGLKK